MGRLALALLLLGGTAYAERAPDVKAFVKDAETCQHWSGEPAELGEHPTKAELARAKEVERNAKKYCDPLAAREKRLRKKYDGDLAQTCAIDSAMQPIDDRKVEMACSAILDLQLPKK